MNHRKITYLVLGIWALLFSGCATINSNPDILLQEPYTGVRYMANPDKGYVKAAEIEVETSGDSANILNTIPLLYEKALTYGTHGEVIIGNIRISSFTKSEDVQVPYRDCFFIPIRIQVPRTNCTNGDCKTTYSTETRYDEMCITRYRLETRDILHQTAKADILKPNPERPGAVR